MGEGRYLPSLPRPEPAPLSTRSEVPGDRRGGSIVVRQQTISHAGDRVASVAGLGPAEAEGDGEERGLLPASQSPAWTARETR